MNKELLTPHFSNSPSDETECVSSRSESPTNTANESLSDHEMVGQLTCIDDLETAPAAVQESGGSLTYWGDSANDGTTVDC